MPIHVTMPTSSTTMRSPSGAGIGSRSTGCRGCPANEATPSNAGKAAEL